MSGEAGGNAGWTTARRGQGRGRGWGWRPARAPRVCPGRRPAACLTGAAERPGARECSQAGHRSLLVGHKVSWARAGAGSSWGHQDGRRPRSDAAAPWARRLFGIKCAKCQVGFSSSDLVMRARDSVYHIECFRCSVCSRQLLPGDEFSLREHELLCRADHGLLLERAAADSPRSPGPLPGARGLHLSDPGSGRQPTLRPHVHKQTEKTTRVRTVLNEKQLHTLRTCYAANPRPDALMKEQLVEMTGLSPRVIRVWFQNKRCKDKKKSILMKQLQQQQHSDKTSLQGLTGTPLVAGSPIRHENAVQGSAVEVQTYQPPWKALSEFALQSDLDQPAFQQLVSFSESGSLGNSSGSDVTSLSSQLPDTPNSMVPSPVET
uniref:Insulin gene enhancer protein ISL-2 n=1 Tax=Callithrix jacchus TaxID=9483 RepID=A0A8I3W0I8_CALJA